MNTPQISRIGATGLEVSSLGLGCAPLGNLYRPLDDSVASDIFAAAWNHGIRLFDTAPHYGQGLSERRVGDALRRESRGDYVLSTKVGRLLSPAGYATERHGFVSPMPFDISYDYSYGGVMRSHEHSLQRLGLDRIDILLMHDIGRATHADRNDELFPIAMQEGYRAMAELRSNGDVRAIGIGANEWEVCTMALDHGDWDCFLAGRPLYAAGAGSFAFVSSSLRGSQLFGGGWRSVQFRDLGFRGSRRRNRLLQLPASATRCPGKGVGVWKMPAQSTGFRSPRRRYSFRWPIRLLHR